LFELKEKFEENLENKLLKAEMCLNEKHYSISKKSLFKIIDKNE